MESTIASNTYQIVDLESKVGKKFLRKLIREQQEFTMSSQWSAHAWANNTDESCTSQYPFDVHWKLEFRRTIKGEIGQPDVDITVRTMTTIKIRKGDFGSHKSFSDCDAVEIPLPTRMFLMCSCVSILAHFLLADASLRIDPSHGSTSSSKHGIGQTSLNAYLRNDRGSIGMAQIGSSSMYVHGVRVVAGAVD